jgi:hypothetical protein
MTPLLTTPGNRVSQPFIIIRLWPQHHASEAAVEELLREFKRHPGCCDEVWFCTEVGFPKMEAHRRSAERMTRAAERMRAAKILPGLQIANTIGHSDDPIAVNDGIRWQRLVGHDGKVASRCNCPRAPEFHDYLRAMMTAYAAFQPSSVWVDDDLRLNAHSPVEFGCFCDRCVRAFATVTGREWQREPLVKALNDLEDGSVRLAWTRFNQESLAAVAATIARAVHGVAAHCRLGLQHAGTDHWLYNGSGLNGVFEAMTAVTGRPVGSRPGGGFYTDHRPREMIQKAFEIGRQVAQLPACVDFICPEVENHTHVAMGKSAHGTVVESTLGLALGCNALSYAILCSGHEPLAWYGGLLAKIAAWRPFWERFMADNNHTAPGGLEVALGAGHAARTLPQDAPPFAWNFVGFGHIYQLATLGLPLCLGPSTACGVVLTASAIGGLGEDELRRRLAGGALTDGDGLLRLLERGLGKLLDVKAEKLAPPDTPVFDRFTSDPLNGAHAGYRWRPRGVTGGAGGLTRIELAPERARILSQFVDRDGRALGAATAAIETPAGGRLGVINYCGWEHVVSAARRAQLLALADWVSRGRLPVLVDTVAQLAALSRVDGAGHLRSVTLLNPSIGPTPPLRLRLRGAPAGSVQWVMPEATSRNLRAERHGSERLVRVPALAAWAVGYLRIAH